MRITHLIRSDGWAGVETHVLRLALEQARIGHTVRMVGADAGAVRSRVLHGELQHTAARTVRDCVTALRDRPAPDVVHVHMTAAELAAALSLRVRGVPVVSTRHFADTRGAHAITRPVVRLAERRVAAQIAVSQYVADRIDGESTVILSGVEAKDHARPAADRDRVVLVAQRLEPEKNTSLALEAFARSGLADEGWRLDIAGEGTLRPALEASAARLGIQDATRFLGHRSDVECLMAAAGILLAPYHGEAFGLSVVEAMALALPVVAAGGGGHVETVGPVPGAALFAPRDAAGAAALLRSLAADTSRRETYGRALRERQRTFLTVEAQARATDDVYRRVL